MIASWLSARAPQTFSIRILGLTRKWDFGSRIRRRSAGLLGLLLVMGHTSAQAANPWEIEDTYYWGQDWSICVGITSVGAFEQCIEDHYNSTTASPPWLADADLVWGGYAGHTTGWYFDVYMTHQSNGRLPLALDNIMVYYDFDGLCPDPNTILNLATRQCEPLPGFQLVPQMSGPCPKPPVADLSNPCDVSSGNKTQVEIDYAPSAYGAPGFSRHYNSMGPYRSAESLAHGWRHTYSRAIDERPDKYAVTNFAATDFQSASYATEQDACESGWGDIKTSVWGGELSAATATFSGGNICEISSGGSVNAYFLVRDSRSRSGFAASSTIRTVSRPNGSVVHFKQSGTDWINVLDPAITLEQSGTNWVFTNIDESEETYDSSGRLISIVQRNGLTETLEYDLTIAQGGDDDSSTLDRVTGEFGHEITFAYDSNARLISIDTPDGAITYGYDSNNNLSSVTYPDTSTRQYVYDHSYLPNHLTGIIDENNDRFSTWDYDETERAVLSEHAGGKEQVQLVHNANGTTTISTANGATRTYTFTTVQGQRKLSGIVGDVCSNCGDGNTKSRTYDASGFLDEATDWNGNITKTARNSRGLTETLTEAKNTTEERVTTTVWHASYRLPTKVTTPKNVTDYVYDTDGNPTSITITGGTDTRAWTITYNNDGQPLTIDGPRTDLSDVTTFDYYTCSTGDECGQLESVTNALSQVTTFDSYDASGRVTQITDPNGLQTAFTYDSRGNPLTVTETPTAGSARTTTMTYDDAGQLETLTTPNGTVLTYAYDAAHYLTSVTDNSGNKIQYTYDAMGNVTDQDTYDPTSTLKRSLDYAYDLNDRLDSVTSGSITTDLNLDLIGNLTSEVDGNQATTQHIYDALNRLDQTTDALNGVIDYVFDAHDNVTSVTAPNSAVTTYEYDDLDNLTKEISADRGTTTYTYDDAGNLKTKTDARSITATYTYDALNRLTGVTYPNTSENVTYTYDHVTSEGIGRLRSITDESGTTTYTYDEFGNVLSDVRQIGTNTYTTSYTYNGDGDIATITYPSGRVVTYTRNVLGQTTQVTSNNGTTKTVLSSVSYEPFGPISSLTYGNSVTFDYQYGTDYSVSDIDASGISDKSYEYDPVGNITAISDGIDASLNQILAYDALRRVTSDSRAGTGNGGYSADVLADGPLAYWRLGETSGTWAADATGNNYGATYRIQVTQGQPGLAPGPDTAIRINTQGAGYLTTGAMSGKTITGVELWFQTDNVANHRDLISINASKYVQALLYHSMSGKVAVWSAGAWGDVLESDSTVSTNEAHHVAVWYESASNTSYMMVDGVTQTNTYTGNVLSATDPLVIIAGYYGSGTRYSRALGEIDEVAVYDSAMTEAVFANRLLSGHTGTTYDANGNRTSVIRFAGTTNYSYQAQSNRLTAVDGSTVQRDLAGNRTAEPGGIRTYSYNNGNRLSAVLDNAVTTASYVHNALGQRVKKTVGSAVVVYIYDLFGNLIAEHDGTGALIRDYVWLETLQLRRSTPVKYFHTCTSITWAHLELRQTTVRLWSGVGIAMRLARRCQIRTRMVIAMT